MSPPVPLPESARITLEGQVERVTYHDPASHFTIAKLKPEGQRDLVTIVGHFPSLAPGEVLRLAGVYERHPRYGRQLRVEQSESLAPATLLGIERYLGSGLIKGLGPEMAKRIIRRFGLQTLEVLDETPQRLTAVEGLGPKRVEQIKAAWGEQREIRRLMIFLQGQGITTGLATKIFKFYGREALARLQDNPYALASDLFGVGFITADRLAEKMGIARDSRQRLEAGLLYFLQTKGEEGHVGFPREELERRTAEQLDVDLRLVEQTLDELLRLGQLQARSLPEGGPLIMVPYLDRCEAGIVQRLGELETDTQAFREGLHDALASVERTLRIQLSERQRAALDQALTRKLLIITGGPGTGKTTLVRSILETFRRVRRKCVLMAPTGRAAKRLAEVTFHPAATIHRTLRYSPKQGKFLQDRSDPLDADLVIVDEASMIDTVLMYHLLKAIPDRAVFILVGDAYQLPSVGPGQVLSDLIGSGRLPVVELDQIFRQEEGSLIVANAHRIHQGEMPLLPVETEDRLQEFFFIQQEEPEKAARWILELVRKRIPQRYGLDPFLEIQVLTPMYKGAVGAENLNALLQEGLNPESGGLQRGPRLFKMGDKVMQVRNNYDREVFNGDLGRVARIDMENQELLVNFDGQFVPYDFSDLDELTLAYAVSVHKSQGNEYPAVVLPVMTQHYILLQRNLIYTAITRAKRLIVLVGTKKALAIAVKNDKTQYRYSALKERLNER